jgi:hypothetical protein
MWMFISEFPAVCTFNLHPFTYILRLSMCSPDRFMFILSRLMSSRHRFMCSLRLLPWNGIRCIATTTIIRLMDMATVTGTAMACPIGGTAARKILTGTESRYLATYVVGELPFQSGPFTQASIKKNLA